MQLIVLKILRRLNVLKNANFSIKKFINGHEFQIPLMGEIGLTNVFLTEPWMIELLTKILNSKSGLFVDVGVNIGQTLIKLKSVDNNCEYLGFEPNPTCIHYVNKLVKENKFENVNLVPVGIADSTTLGIFNYFYENSADTTASIVAEFRPDQKINRKEYIPIFDMSFLKGVLFEKQISVLKVDVEGAELEVIRCFEEKIKEDQPYVLIEILPAYSSANKERIDRQVEIQRILRGLEYTFYRILKLNNKLKGFEKIEEIEVHSDINLCDYLCLPKNNEVNFRQS